MNRAAQEIALTRQFVIVTFGRREVYLWPSEMLAEQNLRASSQL